MSEPRNQTHDELELDAALRARLTLDERPGPAARISSARALSMVEGALDAALTSAPAAGMDAHVTPIARARARLAALGPVTRVLAIAAAALLMFVGGAAAAKLVTGVIEQRAQHEAVAVSAQAAVARARTNESAAPSAKPPAPAIEAPAIEAPVLAEPESREPEAKPAPRAHVRERERVLEDLLQRANRERAAGRFRAAAALYAQVYEGDARSLSAYVARVAAASIELEHLERPARARALFEAALRGFPDGALDLEARQGLALALRDLGAREQEAAALRALIDKHPKRPAAARARARLAELQP